MAKKSRKVGNDPFYLPLDNNESWLNRTWRPAAAIVYLVICIFDFIIAPAWAGMHNPTAAQLALAAKGLDPQVGSVLVAAREQWQPLTLQGSGLFHVAFGAILGVTAWTRGAAQIEQLRQRGESVRSPDTAYPYNDDDADNSENNSRPKKGRTGSSQQVDNPDEA